MNAPFDASAQSESVATPRTLLTKGGEHRPDDGVMLDAGAPLVAGATSLMPLTSWEASPGILDDAGDAAFGILVEPGDDPYALKPLLERLPLIAVHFPKIADGRGYTHAHRFRNELGYRGELRAVGDVGVDQLHYLLRVGFDTFVLRPGTDVGAAKAALERFSHFYVGVETRTRSAF